MLRRRMSSRAVKVGMLGTLSMSLAACGSSYSASCVDGTDRGTFGYKVVDDDRCDYGGNGGRYFWYYNGSGSNGYVSGGTTLKPRKGTIKTKSGRTLQRGGFGSKSSSGS